MRKYLSRIESLALEELELQVYAYCEAVLRRGRISSEEQILVGLSNRELVDVGFRFDGVNGWRIES